MNLLWIVLAIGLLFGLGLRQNAVVNTGLLTRGLRSEFFNRYESLPKPWEPLCTTIKSDGDSETYRWLGTVPRIREWGTGRLAKGLRTESYSVANLKYEATIEVDRDEISDDQTGQIRIRVNELATAAGDHKNFLLGQLLINGGNAGWNSYDGVPFFSAAHVSGQSGVQTNMQNSPAANPQMPTSAEFRTSLMNAIALMMRFRDDQGEPMPMDATGLVVMVPWNMYFTALEAVNAAMLNNTSNVMTNVPITVVGFSRLALNTTWYLCKTDGVIRPFIFQDREPIDFGSLAEGSEEDFKREKFLYGVRARYAMTYGYWQYCVRSIFV